MVVLRARPPTILTEFEQREGRPVVTPTRIAALHVKYGHSDGEWHRLLLDSAHPYRGAGTWRTQSIQGTRTACGSVITGYYAMREESYAGKLCTRGCFTAVEHQVAAELRLAEEQAQRDAEAQAQEEHAELDRKIEESRARARQRQEEYARRFATGEQPPVPKKPSGGDPEAG